MIIGNAILDVTTQSARAILTKQLRRRFGELPDWAMTQLEQASTEQLELWAEQIFDAESLENLLDKTDAQA